MNDRVEKFLRRFGFFGGREQAHKIVTDAAKQTEAEIGVDEAANTVEESPAFVDEKISIKAALERISDGYLNESRYDVTKKDFVEAVDLARPLEWLWEAINIRVEERAQFKLARNIETSQVLLDQLEAASPFKMKRVRDPNQTIGHYPSESAHYDTSKILIGVRWFATNLPAFVREIENTQRLTDGDKMFLDFVKHRAGPLLAPALFRADGVPRTEPPPP